MKKTIVLLMVMFVSLSIQAQANPDAKAKLLVDKLDKVVRLSESEKTQIYDLEIKRLAEKEQIRKDNDGNDQVIRKKSNELDKEWRSNVSELITPERMKLWSDYQKEQKAKREQKASE